MLFHVHVRFTAKEDGVKASWSIYVFLKNQTSEHFLWNPCSTGRDRDMRKLLCFCIDQMTKAFGPIHQMAQFAPNLPSM